MSEKTPIPKISAPANRALDNAGYTQLEQLAHVTEKEIADLHGMGKKGIDILNKALAEKGFAFAPAKEK